MWTLIDNYSNTEHSFSTYACQVGSIGCLVLVIGPMVSTTFVPGVQIINGQLISSLDAAEEDKGIFRTSGGHFDRHDGRLTGWVDLDCQ